MLYPYFKATKYSKVINTDVMIVHVPDRDIDDELNEYLHSS